LKLYASANPDLFSLIQVVGSIDYVNASSIMLPFASHSIHRIIALESHYHFKPLRLFIQELKGILDPDGVPCYRKPI
jgi:hypothetical protein